MFRPVRTVIAVSVLAVVLASTALAALPAKGAAYEGTLYADGATAVVKKVRLKVDASGKRARVTWLCGSGRVQNTLLFTIKPDGTFRAFSNTGSLTVWSFAGRFVSKQQISAVLHLNATCDGKGGKLKLNLTPKA